MAVPNSDVTAKVRQSPRLDFPTGPVSLTHLAHKTILITGGASGFGAGCVSAWAAAGARVVFGDISSPRGLELESSVRTTTGNPHVHFVRCDVTSWPSQVALFKTAVAHSAHGGIDMVVANAGITDSKMEFENPRGLDTEDPPAPSMACLDVNLTGVVYTTHLALFWLPRNPGSVPSSPKCEVREMSRDRHLMLMGSIASLGPIPMQAFYGASKHAVLGLFRCLRSTVFQHGIRLSFVAPYFIDTPIVPAAGRALLAGGVMGKPEDVVEAMTRFAADPRIVGRAVCVCPRLKVKEIEDGEWEIVPNGKDGGEEKAVWEFNAGDFEDVEVWNRRMIGLLNAAEVAKGRIGFALDLLGAMKYAVTAYFRVP